MCASSPQIQAGLKIGRQAELYQHEKNIQAAVESFRSSLSMLVPLLRCEPNGGRKEMLHTQVA